MHLFNVVLPPDLHKIINFQLFQHFSAYLGTIIDRSILKSYLFLKKGV